MGNFCFNPKNIDDFDYQQIYKICLKCHNKKIYNSRIEIIHLTQVENSKIVSNNDNETNEYIENISNIHDINIHSTNKKNLNNYYIITCKCEHQHIFNYYSNSKNHYEYVINYFLNQTSNHNHNHNHNQNNIVEIVSASATATATTATAPIEYEYEYENVYDK